MQVVCRTSGDSADEALAGAKWALNTMAKGKKAIIRTMPEVSSDTDFETKQKVYQGYARFHVYPEAGEWVKPAGGVRFVSFDAFRPQTDTDGNGAKQ